MKKRFIEYDMPLAEISEESAREKNIRHGHPSTLHIWWARRPLASSRATNFAALIDLPDDPVKREEIKELIRKISPWEEVKNGNSENIERAKALLKEQWGDTPPKVIDPFAGGGSIPLEALRLGCETYANDLNPVAVFIEKATLEWPQKFGVMIDNPDKTRQHKQQSLEGDGGADKVNFLSYMVEKWGNKILEEAKAEIGRFYPHDPDGSIPVGYIWARTIPCQNPACGAEIPLVRQFWLAKKENKKVAYKPVVDKGTKKVSFVIQEGKKIDFDPDDGTITRADAACPVCVQITKAKDVSWIALNGKMNARMVAVVLHHPDKQGKKYRVATERDIEIFSDAETYLNNKIKNWHWLDSPLPDEELPPVGTLGFRIQRYGMKRWHDLFNSRQKLALITFMDKIKGNYEELKEDCCIMGIEKYGLDCGEAAKVLIGYLAFIISRCSDFESNLVRWFNHVENTCNTFARQALPMTWDFFELNLFSRSSQGTFKSMSKQVLKAIEFLTQTYYSSSGINTQSSATSLQYSDNYFDAVLTDPPYYDNVPYSDLSDFFYVWLKRSVGDIFPDVFSTPLTPKNMEAIADPLRRGGDEEAKQFFEKSLSDSFKEMHRILKPGGIAVIVYAHKTTSGWETMLNSLVNAGLVVTASWPIHTEMKARLRAAASAALASSIYMVCRKTERQPVGYYSELQPKIKIRIEEKLQQFWNEGIAGGDFFISAIGPAMETFSQYEKVEKYSGEKVTTAELLDYIRTVSTDFIVKKLLKDASSANIDNESKFYLTYRWTHLDNTVPFDDAMKLAHAEGINLEELWGAHGFVKKKGSDIEVLGPKERGDIGKIGSMVDVMHRTVLLWEKGDREAINKLLSDTGYGASGAFWQFCQAVAESLINGNKEKQLLEGLLIGKDNYIGGSKPKEQKGLSDYN
jgi:putative DNA methylase